VARGPGAGNREPISQRHCRQVLPFDRNPARIYGALAAQRKRTGRSIDVPELLIAAIARARNVQAIATRNTSDFADCGVPLINPWQPPSPRRHP
jgi:predicted nucleic acid-binding protein